MQRMSFATAGCALALMASLPAAAQPQPDVICGPRAEILAALERNFGEVPVAAGSLQGVRLPLMAELLVAEDGSWTLITTDELARSCIQVGGAMWTEAAKPKTAKPVQRQKGGL